MWKPVSRQGAELKFALYQAVFSSNGGKISALTRSSGLPFSVTNSEIPLMVSCGSSLWKLSGIAECAGMFTHSALSNWWFLKYWRAALRPATTGFLSGFESASTIWTRVSRSDSLIISARKTKGWEAAIVWWYKKRTGSFGFRIPAKRFPTCFTDSGALEYQSLDMGPAFGWVFRIKTSTRPVPSKASIARARTNTEMDCERPFPKASTLNGPVRTSAP